MDPTSTEAPGVPQRYVLLLSGALVFAAFLISISYATGFVGNFLVPKSVDGPRNAPFHSEQGDLPGAGPRYAEHKCTPRPLVARLEVVSQATANIS
jgi:hypothetical protein